MIESHEGREERQIRIETLRGGVEGFLHTNSMVRTLDEVNVVTGNFLTLHSPRSYSGEWKLDGGPLAISKSSTLFVMEMAAPAARARRRGDAVRFSRSPVRLWVKQVSVQGFVHVPPGGTAMSRLNQSSHDFMALTSVSVVGPNFEFATPFLAVNRAFISAAQEIRPEHVDDDLVSPKELESATASARDHSDS